MAREAARAWALCDQPGVEVSSEPDSAFLEHRFVHFILSLSQVVLDVHAFALIGVASWSPRTQWHAPSVCGPMQSLSLRSPVRKLLASRPRPGQEHPRIPLSVPLTARMRAVLQRVTGACVHGKQLRTALPSMVVFALTGQFPDGSRRQARLDDWTGCSCVDRHRDRG